MNWGDGNSSSITSWNSAEKTHSYAEAGEYEISITGKITGWSFGNDVDDILNYDNAEAEKLSKITSWGPLGFGNTTDQFLGCSNLVITATDKPSLERTTSLMNAFLDCYKIETVPGMESWNTANVTDMSFMFVSADAFNQDLSGWNTQNVTDMSGMFFWAEAFNQDLSGWEVGQVTDYDDIFIAALAMEEENKPSKFR